MSADDIRYSDKYEDDNYIYRHVMLPPDLAKQVPKTHLMTETEWRNLGVQQSPGWIHYMLHLPGNENWVKNRYVLSLFFDLLPIFSWLKTPILQIFVAPVKWLKRERERER
ncbi:cyclin-dependent kinases regulatory subunit-like [Diaphorina citri]|uniref:Cyclin-dependent kinases regulatory subunit n=1 Tax=Diaphorina citri TaxID=121845 RepID=A0A1S4E8I4_DIACI|nr:cyclin-dependent kinases regulatory subunit-like [Diaphorina citri]